MQSNEDNDDDCGTPQPASEPMDFATADRLAKLSHGQMNKFLHGDGHWYLYYTKGSLIGIGIQPKVPLTP